MNENAVIITIISMYVRARVCVREYVGMPRSSNATHIPRWNLNKVFVNYTLRLAVNEQHRTWYLVKVLFQGCMLLEYAVFTLTSQTSLWQGKGNAWIKLYFSDLFASITRIWLFGYVCVISFPSSTYVFFFLSFF